jgi:hypothetical protein
MTEPFILVTYDNNMTVEHGDVLRECKTTLAVIDSGHRAASGLTEVQYWHEVTHRHAHRFVVQEPATRVKYRCSARTTAIAL